MSPLHWITSRTGDWVDAPQPQRISTTQSGQSESRCVLRKRGGCIRQFRTSTKIEQEQSNGQDSPSGVALFPVARPSPAYLHAALHRPCADKRLSAVQVR